MLSIDVFDLLPDPLLLLILNKLCDIKSLGRCSAVSSRFRTLIPQVDDVVVKVDCVIDEEECGSRHSSSRSSGSIVRKGKGFFLAHLLRSLVGGFLLKPLHALQQHIVAPKKKSGVLPEVSHHSPGEVLRSFKQVRSLRIELPGGELGLEAGPVLQWRAEFGSTLERCVILSASSMVDCDEQRSSKPGLMHDRCAAEEKNLEQADIRSGSPQDDHSVSMPQSSFFANGGLKLRVVWTISSLIAASARHHLLQQIICEHPSLESLVLADADGQGTLCMGKQQLRDCRDKPTAAAAASAPSSKRTQVPALNMKLWYAPLLDLPGGGALRGATLVDIRPSHQVSSSSSSPSGNKGPEEPHHPPSAAFEEPFKSAASSLVRRRTYLLEMNSF